jgi:hypothetical protein
MFLVFYVRKNDCFVRFVDDVVESCSKIADFDTINEARTSVV